MNENSILLFYYIYFAMLLTDELLYCINMISRHNVSIQIDYIAIDKATDVSYNMYTVYQNQK